MQKTSIDKLLFQNISELEKLILVQLNNIVEENQKSIGLKDSSTHFFNKNLKGVVVNYLTNKQIISIASTFNGSLTNELFQQIISEYGNPDIMAKKGEVLFSENSIIENGAEIKEEKGELIPCKLTEKPIIVNWYLQKFEIRLTINYQKNTTLLIIKAPNTSQQMRF